MDDLYLLAIVINTNYRGMYNDWRAMQPLQVLLSVAIYQWEYTRILKWRYVRTIFLAIFCGDIHLHRPEK